MVNAEFVRTRQLLVLPFLNTQIELDKIKKEFVIKLKFRVKNLDNPKRLKRFLFCNKHKAVRTCIVNPRKNRRLLCETTHNV
jgi:hypothetical protein